MNFTRLRGRIKGEGLTEDQLASRIGISKSTMSEKLNEKSEFSRKEIYLISRELKLSEAELNDYFFCIESSETIN